MDSKWTVVASGNFKYAEAIYDLARMAEDEWGSEYQLHATVIEGRNCSTRGSGPYTNVACGRRAYQEIDHSRLDTSGVRSGPPVSQQVSIAIVRQAGTPSPAPS